MAHPRVLFVCVHNSGRSQMAEALFNRLAAGRATAESAGTLVADAINPTVAQAMTEIDIDLAGHSPKIITQEQVDRSDRAYTMGCAIDESCPATFVPSEDWGVDDPSGRPIEEVRRIRDQVVVKVSALLDDLGVEYRPIDARR